MVTDPKNKIALITGGANGIGFVTAIELLRNDAAHVAILDLKNSKGEESVKKLNDEFGKGRAIFIVCDVTKSEELEAAFEMTVKKFGGLDIVINDAGIMDDLRWELMIQINFNAVVRGTLLGFKYMGQDQNCKGGTIVNVSSTLGVVPVSSHPIYSGTKHAVVGLSRSFGEPYHFRKTGVRVLTLCPSATNTYLLARCPETKLDNITSEEIESVLQKFPPQSPENVARGLIKLIREGKSGSVWISEVDKPAYELKLLKQSIEKGLVKVD